MKSLSKLGTSRLAGRSENGLAEKSPYRISKRLAALRPVTDENIDGIVCVARVMLLQPQVQCLGKKNTKVGKSEGRG